MERSEYSDEEILQNCYCFPPICRLCRFSLAKGEIVVVVVDGRTSLRFSCSLFSFVDKDLKSAFHECSGSCHHYDGQVLGYHAGCLEFAPDSSPPFLRATEYSFEPMPCEDQRRFDRIRDLLASRIRDQYTSLPAELRLMVASELVRECAISTIQGLWSARCSSNDGNIDISLGVWAHYAHIDGVQYVAALSNMADPRYSCTELLSGNMAATAEVLYILEDKLGIRQLVFASLEDSAKPLPSFNNPRMGLWWRTALLGSKKLETRFDGLKLRSVRSGSGAGLTNFMWPAPISQSELELLRFWSFVPESAHSPPLHNLRMTPVNCNYPSVTGYSACWSSNLIAIYAHHGMADFTLYKDVDAWHSRPIWFHMPIDPGELVSDIWARRGRLYLHMGLMLRTNRGRQMMIAPYTSQLHRHLNGGIDPKWIQFCSLPESPTQIYFNHSLRGVHQLAVKQPGFRPGLPLSLAVSSPEPDNGGNYFYSSAALENIIEITPCRKELEDYSAIVGLLIRYADGHRATVGEFRFDRAGGTLQTDASPGLHLGFLRAERTPSHISRLELGPPQDRASLHWLSLPWKGKLEWWFTYGQCKIYYEDQESPTTL